MKEIDKDNVDLKKQSAKSASKVNSQISDEYDQVLKNTAFLSDISNDEVKDSYDTDEDFTINMDGIFDSGEDFSQDETEEDFEMLDEGLTEFNDKSKPKKKNENHDEDLHKESLDENPEDDKDDLEDDDNSEHDDEYDEDESEYDSEDSENDNEDSENDDEDSEYDDEDSEYDDEDYDEENYDDKPKKKMPIWAKGAIIAFIITLILATPCVFILYHLGKINYTDFSKESQQKEQFDFSDETPDPKATSVKAEDIDWGENLKGSTVYDENVINVLLIGADEKSDVGFRGNSDTMMIASISKTDKTVRLVSLMRDLYVPISGHSDNKLNSAYCTGGPELLKETIENDFKVSIDHTVVVHFDTFEEIIDMLGGVEVEINEKEAEFIDSSLSAGKVNLTGHQALRFSRIRKIKSDIYGHDDFGRTCRQRTVLNALFQKYKDMSYTEIVSTVDKVLPKVTTDMSADVIVKCAALVFSYGIGDIDSLRIPLDNAYEGKNVYIGNYPRPLSVIAIDQYYKENLDALHMFLYGNVNY